MINKEKSTYKLRNAPVSSFTTVDELRQKYPLDAWLSLHHGILSIYWYEREVDIEDAS